MIFELPNKFYSDENFVSFLKDYLKDYILQSINPQKLVVIDHELSIMFPSMTVKARDVILSGAINLQVYSSNQRKQISVDSNMKFGTTALNLLSLCKMINYGSLSFDGYPIFTSSFQYVLKHIESIYYIYLVEVL